MLQIRPQLIDAFGRDQDERLAARLAAFLSEMYPEPAEEAGAGLQDGIERQFVKARGYGLATEYELASYSTVAFALGENFDSEFPAAADVLNCAPLPALEKAEWLLEWSAEMFRALEEGM